MTMPLLLAGSQYPAEQGVVSNEQGAVCSEQKLWLEASTLSNRGEMLQHLPTDYGHTTHRWLEASTTLSNEY